VNALDAYGARLLDSVPLAADPVAQELAVGAIAAFVDAAGRVETAVATVDPLLRRLGTHHSRLGTRPQEFALAFAIIHQVAQDGLPLALPSGTSPGRGVRRSVSEYVAALAAGATAALVRAHARSAAGGYDREALRRALFGPPSEESRDLVAVADELDGLPQVQVLVAAGGRPELAGRAVLPEVMRTVPGVICGPDRAALAVRSGTAAKRLIALARRRRRAGTQIVVGEPTSWRDAPTSLALARRAAELLSGGRVRDDRVVVPFADLAKALHLAADVHLRELLIRHHLAPLLDLPPTRRLTLGTTLLRWLERGQGGVRFEEMQELRLLFGDRLDPAADLEPLAVTLRLALPRWTGGR